MARTRGNGRHGRTSAIAAATALVALTIATLAAPAATAAQSASVVEGRERILVTVVRDHPQETIDETIWLDGRELQHCGRGNRNTVGQIRYHRVCDVPARRPPSHPGT
ncbi:hypothetical protein [Nocardia brevicatena]|uniref:hypothetical protein n=1 Tax=Nocardia brevicatena TaxID=37327 RepID=UPI0002EE0A17|nr:hypothetical protein [Nocardia brevicatena]